MSCISKILELKGNKEYILSNNKSVAVEDGGIYKCYEYLITFVRGGHRCGYIALSENHPLNKYNLVNEYPDNFIIKVHGGITLHEESRGEEFGLKENSCKDKWIGFDAAHCNDLPDTNLSQEIFGVKIYDDAFINEMKQFPTVKVRTKKYMINQCKKLIDQVIKYEMDNNQ